ncbi:MAG: DUF4381 domain-containing protein [Oceanospirillaceae bacterium]|nr:DUF4381 domain-containing protein [Oceanospirillaceae bacterium]
MKTQQSAPSLDQLQGLHLPEAVTNLPIAPGWVLAVIVLIVTGLLAAKFMHRCIMKNAYRREAIKHLGKMFQDHQSHNSDQRLLVEINQLLKSVAIRRYPQAGCAKLSGASWQTFLARSSCNIKAIEADVFHEFVNIYAQDVDLSLARRETLCNSATLWLKKHHNLIAIKEESIV